MMRTIERPFIRSKWGQRQVVEDRINRDTASGALAPGARLPTEIEIMQRFSVGRHTARRAIAEFASAGNVRAKQGRGTFVEERSVIHYNSARRTRFSKNLKEQGRVPPASRFPNMHIRRRAGVSVTEIYRDLGLRHRTTIFTRLPIAEETRLLAQSQEQPVLVVQKVDIDMQGCPVGSSETVWAGERIQFAIDNDEEPGHADAATGTRREKEA